MKLIAAVDKNWGIGYENKLFVSIPEDMKQFQILTTGNIVVMGRKTLQSLPNGLPLSQRQNIVLTTNEMLQTKGVTYTHSVGETIQLLQNYDTSRVYIAGGESIYQQFLPYADEAYITYIDFAYRADAHMPNLDEAAEWELYEESEEQTYFDLEYYFRKYRKKR
jgi:dihydrofolate reductase